MGGTCADNANTGQIAAAVLTIPQTINTNNMTGTINYIYHYCNDSCYEDYLEKCGNYYYSSKRSEHYDDGGYLDFYFARCNCGASYRETINNGGSEIGNYAGYCNQDIEKTRKICGYSDGQLIGAEITY